MQLIDTHTHIYLEEFDSDREEVVNRAIAGGIEKMILPNVDLETIDALQKTTSLFPSNLYMALGLHPCSVKHDYKSHLDKLFSLYKPGEFIAIGETGLDLYWDKTFYKEQIEALEIQINWALDFNLPIILHCRETTAQTIEVVKKYKTLKGVFHAFSGNVDEAKQVIDLGYKIGIGGVVTFKNSGLDKIVEQLPLSSLVLETDAPYLTPTPHRGKRNEPIYLKLVVEKLASIYNCTNDEIAEKTTNNAIALFGF
jgi:TatD DNase family protein